MPPAETTTVTYATKGGRALIVHAWTEGRTYWTSLCKQLQITIGSPAFCRKDSMKVAGLVACDLCAAAERGEVNPHAEAHQLPPTAEKKALAKIDATERDEKPAAGACIYKESKDAAGVCSCGLLQEDHDASLVPGADKILEAAGPCTTCGLEVKRLPDGGLQHVQTNGVLTMKGRGGCKAAKLEKGHAPLVPPQPPAAPKADKPLFNRTKGYTPRPSEDPVATVAADLQERVDAGERVTATEAAAAFRAADPTPGPMKGPDAPAEPKGDEACTPACGPELPLHQQPGICDHGTPLVAECTGCDATSG